MGLALDELDRSAEGIISHNGIDIVCDDRARYYLEHYPQVRIDYIHGGGYGHGFIIDTGGRYGSSCC